MPLFGGVQSLQGGLFLFINEFMERSAGRFHELTATHMIAGRIVLILLVLPQLALCRP